MAARNRRRARDRRVQQPAPDDVRLSAKGLEETPGAPEAAGDGASSEAEPSQGEQAAGEDRPDGEGLHGEAPRGAGEGEHTPEPLEHAAPDVELADAQIMLGAGGFVRDHDEGSAEYDRIYADELPEGAADEDELAPEPLAAGGGASGGGGTRAPAATDDGGGASEVAAPAVVSPERPGIVSRLTNFLRGSWRELHRVQWPDRRQVMQATGVVLGFVIAAGIYLGVADFISQKVVHFILTK